jgi:hypothetical protein
MMLTYQMLLDVRLLESQFDQLSEQGVNEESAFVSLFRCQHLDDICFVFIEDSVVEGEKSGRFIFFLEHQRDCLCEHDALANY